MTIHELNATEDSIVCSCGEWAADPSNGAATINRAFLLHVYKAAEAAQTPEPEETEAIIPVEPQEAPSEAPSPALDLRKLGFELVASRRGLTMVYGKLTENKDRLADLPEKPHNFRPMIGTYAAVSAEANRRNEIQIRHNHLDYLYAPEPRKLEGASK
ncbi:hypothetical protein SEA_SONALI_76 [Arthrobacter phage Sonali]|uniref:Uncharacterized protein n=1 Tax=Arthrobacter phage Sonali TaxID=2510495 RepID=A0A411CQJ3_9CAUD|nr:hypothetical protein HOV09_gp76 [Arthrobacter phage Sonali]QAY16188.1 hypothetical protein SEA_SONALI_76 [Arthrobacter phage Sonali]